MSVLSRRRNDEPQWIAPWGFPNDFGRLWEEFNNFGVAQQRQFVPAIDIRETEDAYIVEADVPGMKKDEVHIEVTDNVLTIKGERKSESEEKRKDFHRVERQYGTFRRSVTVPGGFEHDNVEAKFDDGVLRITLPKPPERKPRRIEVKTK